MTPEQQDQQQRNLHQAQSDLGYIAELRRSEPFNRYFIRRLKEQRTNLARSFIEDEMTHEKRELTRQLILRYDSIFGLLDADEAVRVKMLT